MFSDAIRNEISQVAKTLGIEAAGMLAVVEVESAGKLFALVSGRNEPLIRFEGHYFDRRLDAGKRAAARAQGLASPQAGKVANPRTQAARWALLKRAAAIDHKAAHESVSWGAGQVMGAHWGWLGYASVDDLVAEARAGAAGQIRLMARFIDKAGLKKALAGHDWNAFARGYNGPAYKSGGYHQKLAAAYRRHAAGGKAAPAKDDGDAEAVRALQVQLVELGLLSVADGVLGPATDAAIRRFQTQRGLAADGVVGPLTRAALEGAALAGAKTAPLAPPVADAPMAETQPAAVPKTSPVAILLSLISAWFRRRAA